MFLKEAEIPYHVIPLDITKGEQFRPSFLALSRNNRMPAIIDSAPIDAGAPQTVFESGAILLYFAEKEGKLLPREPRARVAALEWLFWQVVWAPQAIDRRVARLTSPRKAQDDPA